MRAQLIGNGLLVARIDKHRAAVLAALQLQGASAEALLSFDDAGWLEVLTLSDRMQLTLPLALRSFRKFPCWVNERLSRNLADTAGRFECARATYREVAAALSGAGVPHLVLKGFTQSPDFVRAPQYRMQSDIDLYTDKEHLHAAVRALEEIGYESNGAEDIYRFADHVPTLIRHRDWKPTPSPYDPKMPLALDVHHCLWNPAVSLIQLPDVDDFWNRRIERKLGELSFPALPPIDHLGYFALHILRELFASGRALHHALELATFLHERTDDLAFWAEWQSQHSPRLRQMQAVPLALAGAAFSSRLPDAVHEQIARLPVGLRVWIETCGGDLLAQTYPRTRDGRLLQLLLSDSASVRRAVLWRALSPGEIAGPAKVASWHGHLCAHPSQHKWWFGRYLAYLASRLSLNGAAVLRFLGRGLTVLLSSFTHYRDTALE